MRVAAESGSPTMVCTSVVSSRCSAKGATVAVRLATVRLVSDAAEPSVTPVIALAPKPYADFSAVVLFCPARSAMKDAAMTGCCKKLFLSAMLRA